MFQLKAYQQDTLTALETYLEDARLTGDTKGAFERFVRQHPTDPGHQAYGHRWGLKHVPYVCLRLPTGGGKTVLASNAIEIAGRAFLEREFPLVLWLVPTNTIRQQTIEALKNNSHPYREAIDKAFDGRVEVYDIGDVTHIRPKDLSDQVCVVVGTLQTLRVTNTDGRRIYAHNENFEPHFAKLPNKAEGLERGDDGQFKYSFVNILHQLAPLIIMDEAHKAGTSLTGEVIQRINPACVIEFTATPTQGNVLYRVSPSELKTAEMIKLPFMLTEHKGWADAITQAVANRATLEKIALGDKDYIRPIALIQAENKDREANVETIKKHLIENENIPENQIAIATGSQRELDGIDLRDKTNLIRFIITVEALKEGWDCPFAYVFCSTQTVRSAVDIEQLLGRVMRMPYAEKREIDDLNKAYAHVISPGFALAAEEMHSKLMNMGFEDDEATANIQPVQGQLKGFDDTPLGRVARVTPPLVLEMTEAPNLERLRSIPKENYSVRETQGSYYIEVTGDINENQAADLVQAIPPKDQKKARKVITRHLHEFYRSKPPFEKGFTFAIPQLCLRIGGDLVQANNDICLEMYGWDLSKCPAAFEDNEFSFDETAQTFIFDIKGAKVEYTLADEAPLYRLGYLADNWDETRLIRWLDKKTRQDDVRQETMLAFVGRSLNSLLNHGDFDLQTLVRAKFLLAKALLDKIERCRAKAYREGFQAVLFKPNAPVETSFDFNFDYKDKEYPSGGELYRGAYIFNKHYYGNDRIRDLKATGEEFHCAQAIDAAPQVKHWVRNLPWGKESSFRLPTSTDFFYPDFVAELTDGRLLAVEYKGADRVDNADTREKDAIGQLWEGKSNGSCLFLLAVKYDSNGRDVYSQINNKVGRK